GAWRAVAAARVVRDADGREDRELDRRRAFAKGAGRRHSRGAGGRRESDGGRGLATTGPRSAIGVAVTVNRPTDAALLARLAQLTPAQRALFERKLRDAGVVVPESEGGIPVRATGADAPLTL